MIKNMKEYKVLYKSKNFPSDRTRTKVVKAPNKKWIRDNWHSIVETDEYRITQIYEYVPTPEKYLMGGDRI